MEKEKERLKKALKKANWNGVYNSIEEVKEVLGSLKLTKYGRNQKREHTLLEQEQHIEHLVNVSRAVLKLHSSIEIVDIPPTKIKNIDILEGLTEEQKNIIKFYVEKKGYTPMGFDVLVKENRIFYFGKELGVTK